MTTPRKFSTIPFPRDYTHDSRFIDVDPRPKTQICHVCARDYYGKCICVPSQPIGGGVVTSLWADKISTNAACL